jgi:A/G-specific adenine glycosylase
LPDIKPFATRVIAWQRTHGRHGLPWQGSDDPYRAWLSEVMLQQTQVVAVIPYFEKFIARFPTVHALASASVDDVLAHWAGLGYYARARNLHAAAQTLVAQYGTAFPREPTQWAALKGVGRSTANAIAAFSFGARVPILDGNVKRVLARHVGIAGFPGEKSVENALWDVAHSHLPARASHAQMRSYTQGMMDLGAQVCKRRDPLCLLCPISDDCVASRDGTTAQIPAARPSKVVPHHTRWIAVLTTAEHVWLERRASSGIWGGLLSLPEFSTQTEIEAFLSTFVPTPQITRDRPIEHAFTHYRLTLRPLRLRLPARAKPVNLHRVERAALRMQALPAPIKTYLLALPL